MASRLSRLSNRKQEVYSTSIRDQQSNGKPVKLFIVDYQLCTIKQSIFPFDSEQLMVNNEQF